MRRSKLTFVLAMLSMVGVKGFGLLTSTEVFAQGQATVNFILAEPIILEQINVPWAGYWPDGKFCFLPETNNNSWVCYWGEGDTFRTEAGTTLLEDHIANNNWRPVIGRDIERLDGLNDGGSWIIGINRLENGKLVGFFHIESRWPGDGISFKSIGVSYSLENGLTWESIKRILAPNYHKPQEPAWTGLGDGCVVWNSERQQYICYYQEVEAGGLCMAASSDPEGAPGTWKKWDGEGFTIEGCNQETQIGGKPALIKGLQSVLGSNPSVMWNDYLQKWIMVYAKWGGDIYVSSSIDGIEWSTPALLLTESINPLYPNLVSEYGDLAGGKSIRLYYSKDQQENGIRKLAYRKIVFYDSNTNNITFTDARVKALCVANWDANNDGELNEAEAAVVTDLGTVFKSNKLIKSFDELQYFTGLNNIANGAFQGCTKLISISIPNNVARIGEHAFEGSGLTRIAIPNGITTIGNWAFQLCENLETVFLPESVENIGGAAFAYCPKLSTINLPSRLRVLSDWLFTNCVAIRSIQIPHSVTTILNNCFQGSGLQSIIIPDGVTSIGNNAFLDCKNLSSITLGNGLTSIDNYAFSSCSSLTDFWCYAEDIPSTRDGLFVNTDIASATLHVPAASLEAYSTTAPWSSFGRIVAIESPYRYYNLVITGIKGGSTGTIQFSEFDLLDDSSNEVEALNVYAGTNGNEGEGWANVADNDVHTKYCSDFNGNIYFLFDATSQINPCGYRFFTANDNDLFPGRNPSSWKLYGSNTKLTDPADPNWVLLDQQNDNMVMQDVCYTPFDFYYGDVPNLLTLNKESIKLTAGDELQLQASDRLHNIQNLTLQWNSSNEAVASVSNQGLVIANSPGTANITVTAAEDNTLRASCTVRVMSTLPGHRYYQFAIEAIGGGDCIQLSEFDLIDINGNEVTPLTTYAHTGNSFSGEEQDNLFDDNKWTKYCGNFTAGTTLYIFIDAGKRVSLSGYRMTTAADTNTYPERNPISWSLLGSDTKSSRPDDVAWTLLDHRENDNTLDAYSFESYDFFFTYQPNYAVNDETKSLSITTEESECIVEFTHNFNGNWEALYLPFAIDYDAIKADFDLAEIDGVVQNDDNNDGTPDITVLSIMGFKGQTTTPNKPYLIRAKKAGKQTIVFDDVTVYPTAEASIDCSSTSTKYEFTGSYKSLSSTALKNRYIVQDGELVKGASKLSPCRWYMTATSRNGAPLNLPSKIRIMPVEDVITGVKTLSDSPVKGESIIYNLVGQRLAKPQKGIIIQNGKKVLIK